MMTPAEATLVIALAAVIGALAMWIAITLCTWGKAPKSAPTAPPVPQRSDNPAPLVDATPARRWHALPGNTRIELGDTGFAITLHTDRTGPLYRVWTPEGRELITQGYDLPLCKAIGERFAAERDEFVCTERPTLPRFHH